MGRESKALASPHVQSECATSPARQRVDKEGRRKSPKPVPIALFSIPTPCRQKCADTSPNAASSGVHGPVASPVAVSIGGSIDASLADTGLDSVADFIDQNGVPQYFSIASPRRAC